MHTSSYCRSACVIEPASKTKAKLTVEDRRSVVRKRVAAVRIGWADAARKIADEGDDVLLLEGFANQGDADHEW
jgi:antitoxin MazE